VVWRFLRQVSVDEEKVARFKEIESQILELDRKITEANASKADRLELSSNKVFFISLIAYLYLGNLFSTFLFCVFKDAKDSMNAAQST
jgi:hypothetical protein